MVKLYGKLTVKIGCSNLHQIARFVVAVVVVDAAVVVVRRQLLMMLKQTSLELKFLPF
jgi:hypothetical protein